MHADVVMIAAVEQLRLLVLVRQLAVAADGALLCNMQHKIRGLKQTIHVGIVTSGLKIMLVVDFTKECKHINYPKLLLSSLKF